jgi:hypothetical protein
LDAASIDCEFDDGLKWKTVKQDEDEIKKRESKRSGVVVKMTAGTRRSRPSF